MSPSGICIDRDNRVVVSDLLNHRLQVFDWVPRQQVLVHRKVFGKEGAEEGQFSFPRGLAVTEHGELLLCDSGNHRLQVFDMNNKYAFIREIGKQGTADGCFEVPLDVCVDRDGNLLVSDTCHRIQVLDIDGNFLKSFGIKGRKDGYFNFPTYMAVDDENAVYICDQGNSRMQVLNATDGTFLHKWGGFKKGPAGEGEEENAAPEGEGENAEEKWCGLKSPAGVAVNTDGMVVITDYEQNEVFVFSPF